MPWSIYLLALLLASSIHIFLMEKIDTYQVNYTVASNGHVKRLGGMRVSTKGGKPDAIQIKTVAAHNHGKKPGDIKVVGMNRINRAWRLVL